MAEKKISYTTRDFQGVRTELINFTRQYYPELVQNFNDAGIFSVFLDDVIGQIFALFILTVAAAESAIGLAILVVYYRIRSTVSIEYINLLKN